MDETTEPEELRLILILLRSARDWTQKDLAERMGTSPSLVSEYEGGRKTVTPRAVERAAEAVGTSPEVLGVLRPAIRMLCLSLRGLPEDDAVLLAYSLTEQLQATLEPFLRDFLESVKYAVLPWGEPSPTDEEFQELPEGSSTKPRAV